MKKLKFLTQLAIKKYVAGRIFEFKLYRQQKYIINQINDTIIHIYEYIGLVLLNIINNLKKKLKIIFNIIF